MHHAQAPKRKAIACKLQTSPKVEYSYKKYATTNENASLEGNMTQPRTLYVLQKIKSDIEIDNISPEAEYIVVCVPRYGAWNFY